MSLIQKGKQISQVLFFQIVAFLITFSTNIIIVRFLPKNEYAVYTTCFTMLGVVTVLSDSGITPIFRRLAGISWSHGLIFAQLVKSLFDLRNRILWAVIPVTIAIASVLFVKQHAGVTSIIIWLIPLAGLLFFEVQKGIYIEVLRIKMLIKEVQFIENALNICRFVFVLGLYFFTHIEYVLFAYVLASYLTVQYARSVAIKYYDPTAQSKLSYKKIMIAKYKELLPNGIYYIVQSQILLFLLYFFIGVEGVADFGALGRITVVFNLLNSVVLNVFSVQFSRTINILELRTKYIQFMSLIVCLAVAVFVGVYLFQHQIIFILGDKYANLEKILLIMTRVSCVTFVAGSINMLNNSKSWVYYNSRFAIPVSIASLLIGLFFLDFKNIEHILYYSMFPVIGTSFLKIADSLRGVKLAFVK